jgi:hypothetical protein
MRYGGSNLCEKFYWNDRSIYVYIVSQNAGNRTFHVAISTTLTLKIYVKLSITPVTVA